MDPDGDYESLHSARSLGGAIFKSAKLDDAEKSNKNSSNDGLDEWKGKDEEMGLKSSPTPNTSKVVLAEEKKGSVDLKPSAPPADDLGCLPSAPPLEPSLHPSPEDDTTAPPTSESSHPPEPPGFKEDPVEGGGSIPDSVALPIGLNNADRALPVASVVPIITDATDAAGEIAPIIHRSENSRTVNENIPMNQDTRISTTRDTARRVPSFFRQPSTHPAPADEVSADHSAHATLADPQSPRDKSEGQGYKCTPCRKIIAAILVAAIVAGVAVGLTKTLKPAENDYPNCHVSHPEWIGDGFCNGGQHNSMECGWDGGDCFKRNWPGCHVSHPEWIGDGFCNGGRHDTAECGWDGGDCVEGETVEPTSESTNDETLTIWPNCRVENPAWIGDGGCDGGRYNSALCGWDGGDCILQSYPDCHVDNPAFVGDNECDGDDYNNEECGWDGGDCINDQYPDCHAHISWIGDGGCDGDEYNTAECGWDGGDCDSENALLWQTYPNCKAGVYPDNIGDGYCDGGGHNTAECNWDGGDCLDFNMQYPDCKVEDPTYIGDDDCDGGQYNTAECNWDGGDCSEFNRKYPDCAVDTPYIIGDGECDVDHNTAECGWDDGDCDIYNGLPDCHVDNVYEIGNGDCYVGEGEDTNYMTPECNYDGGDCLEFKELIDRCGDDFWHCISWTKYDNRDCTGDWWLWTSKNNLEWCQEYCVQLGSRCKAVSRSSRGCKFYNEPDSGTTVESGTKCFKKTVLD